MLPIIGGYQTSMPIYSYLVVSNIVYFHPYLGKISILTNIFQMGWNHQPDSNFEELAMTSSPIEGWGGS